MDMYFIVRLLPSEVMTKDKERTEVIRKVIRRNEGRFLLKDRALLVVKREDFTHLGTGTVTDDCSMPLKHSISHNRGKEVI